MYISTEIADKYQEFFNFMSQEHDLTLTISEMDEIVSESQKLVKKLATPLVSDLLDQDSTDCGCEPETCKMLKGKCKNLAYR